MVQLPIYLDNNATTCPDPRVVEAMLPYLRTSYGNAASHSHAFGWQAAAAVDQARCEVARLIGADSREIIFTSGATESDNLALKGVAEAYTHKGNHIITVNTEHSAILDAARHLARQGLRITYIAVDSTGLADLQAAEDAITGQTILVSVMHANNETGTVQPIARIGEICRRHGVLFHSDATQSVGKIPVDVNAMNIDLMSMSAHKMYGPKGVGALFARRKDPRVRLIAQIDGGGHERERRSGTLNVPGLVGFGKAAELCQLEQADDAERIFRLRDRLHAQLRSFIPSVTLNGDALERLPNTLNLSLPGSDSDALMAGLPDVAISSGSACSSASITPSHVLKALGLSDAEAHSSLRFSLSRYTTEEEVDYVAAKVAAAYERATRLSQHRAA